MKEPATPAQDVTPAPHREQGPAQVDGQDVRRFVRSIDQLQIVRVGPAQARRPCARYGLPVEVYIPVPERSEHGSLLVLCQRRPSLAVDPLIDLSHGPGSTGAVVNHGLHRFGGAHQRTPAPGARRVDDPAGPAMPPELPAGIVDRAPGNPKLARQALVRDVWSGTDDRPALLGREMRATRLGPECSASAGGGPRLDRDPDYPSQKPEAT